MQMQTTRAEDGVVCVGGVGDLPAEVEEGDVAGGEVVGDAAAPVLLAPGDEDAGGRGVEGGAELLDGVLDAGEAGHGAGDLEVAADDDGVLAAHDHADLLAGHGRANPEAPRHRLKGRAKKIRF